MLKNKIQWVFKTAGTKKLADVSSIKSLPKPAVKEHVQLSGLNVWKYFFKNLREYFEVLVIWFKTVKLLSRNLEDPEKGELIVSLMIPLRDSTS